MTLRQCLHSVQGGIIDGMQSSLMDKQAIGAMNTLGYVLQADQQSLRCIAVGVSRLQEVPASQHCKLQVYLHA